MLRLSPLIVASSVLLLSACATKEFVKETVAPVQTSVDGLGTRVQTHDDSLKALDGRLQGSEARIQTLEQEAAARAQAAKNLPAPPGLLMSTVLTDDKIKFTSGRAQLTEQAGRELDQLVAKLKADNQPVFIEIQGHTDATVSLTNSLVAQALSSRTLLATIRGESLSIGGAHGERRSCDSRHSVTANVPSCEQCMRR
jgi:outer membrane protein OmpA-like peptidoglycan-associated protein